MPILHKLKKCKSREHFQNPSMKPVSPLHQSQVKILQGKDKNY